MKTWRIRLASADGQAVDIKRALGRYLLSWLWFLPGLTLAWAIGAKNWALALIPGANMLLWGLTAYLDPQRQFLHDRIAGTRIISVEPQPEKTPSTN